MHKELTLEELISRESPQMQKRIRKETERLKVEYAVTQIVNDLKDSQARLAESLGMTPENASRIERPKSDPLLSNLKRYVENSGGKLSLQVMMPTGEGRVYAL